MDLQTLREIISRSYEGDVEKDFLQNAEKALYTITNMRLDVIKKILRELKSLPGCEHVSLYKNKSHQVQTLTAIVASALNVTNISSSSSADSQRPAPLPPPSTHHAALVTSTPCHEAKRPLSFSNARALSTPSLKPPSQVPVLGNKRDSSGNPVITSSYASSILCTPRRKDIFHQLSVVSGVTKQEILREMMDCPESQLSRDVILLRIMSRKDPHGLAFINFTPTDSFLKQQEDAALDRAILESEQERDKIQMRKRCRVEELKNDLQAELSSAIEFQRSVLLHGVTQPSSSSSPSSSFISTIASRAKGIEAALQGSTLLRLICAFFEHSARSMEAVELVNLHSSGFCKLRTSAAELLLLEMDALKYYQNAAQPYILRLCLTLDQSVPLRSISAIPSMTLNAQMTKQIDFFLHTHQSALLHIFAVETRKFQKGLCKIPSDGAMIPDLFRRKALIPFIDLLQKPIDEEGFEVVDICRAMKLLSDREDDDESSADDEEYDDE